MVTPEEVDPAELESTSAGISWAPWVRFSEMDRNPCENCGKGVYQVRVMLRGTGKPAPIHRACSVDNDGILYIGEGGLAGRVGFLMNLLQEDAKDPRWFRPTFTDYKVLNRIADREMLEVRWAETDDCKQEEKRLIDEYAAKFGEIPPGNNKTGG